MNFLKEKLVPILEWVVLVIFISTSLMVVYLWKINAFSEMWSWQRNFIFGMTIFMVVNAFSIVIGKIKRRFRIKNMTNEEKLFLGLISKEEYENATIDGATLK